MIADITRGVKTKLLRTLGKLVQVPTGAWATRGFFRRRLNVFFYHGVWPDDAPQLRLFTGVSVSRFAADMRALQAYFHFVPLDDLLAESGRPDGHAADGKPLASLTFDDGFDLTAGGATAVLDSLGIPGTVFVNSNSANYRTLMWQHQFSAIRATRGDERYVRGLNAVLEKTGLSPIGAASEQVFVTKRWPQSRKDEYARAVWEACDMPDVGEMLEAQRPYFDWVGLRDWRERGHAVGSHTRAPTRSARS